jgi:hypothetical protein
LLVGHIEPGQQGSPLPPQVEQMRELVSQPRPVVQ